MTTIDELLVQIGKGLKIARLNNAKTIKSHSKFTKQPATNYANYEVGRRPMSLAMLIKLADQHNCNVIIEIISKTQGGWK